MVEGATNEPVSLLIAGCAAFVAGMLEGAVEWALTQRGIAPGQADVPSLRAAVSI